MNKVIDVKTVVQGAIGAMTFGAYHQMTTNKIMELNNEMMNLKHEKEMNELRESQEKEINELREEIHQMRTQNVTTSWFGW